MPRGQRAPIWTPQQDLELASQIMYGYSFSRAAAAVNEKFGTSFSRNAAIGRAHRLGLCQAKFVAKRKPKQSVAAAPTVKRRTTRIVRANGNSEKMRFLEGPETDLGPLRCVEVVPLNLSLVDLAHNGCRYPYGDGPFTFCGHPQTEGSSYCEPHWSLTYARSRSTNEAATERRRRNFRKQYQKHLLEGTENEASHHPSSHQGEAGGAEVILA